MSASVTVRAGASLDVLAYCAAEAPTPARIDGPPQRPLAGGRGQDPPRRDSRHRRPPADIRVNGKVLFRSVANGESLSVVVPAGTYRVSAVATLAGQTLLPGVEPHRQGRHAHPWGRHRGPGLAPAVLVHVLKMPGRDSGDRMPSAVRTGEAGRPPSCSARPRISRVCHRCAFELLSVVFLLLALGVAASARRVGDAAGTLDDPRRPAAGRATWALVALLLRAPAVGPGRRRADLPTCPAPSSVPAARAWRARGARRPGSARAPSSHRATTDRPFRPGAAEARTPWARDYDVGSGRSGPPGSSAGPALGTGRPPSGCTGTGRWSSRTILRSSGWWAGAQSPATLRAASSWPVMWTRRARGVGVLATLPRLRAGRVVEFTAGRRTAQQYMS